MIFLNWGKFLLFLISRIHKMSLDLDSYVEMNKALIIFLTRWKLDLLITFFL